MVDPAKVFLTVTEVSELIGMKPATASQWILDGFLGDKATDKLADVAGATTYLGLETAVALAIASQLRKLGASREVACTAGKAFVKLTLKAGDATLPAPNPKFKSWLIVFPDGDIRVASFKDAPSKKEMEQDCWRLRWEAVIQNVQLEYGARGIR